MGNSRLKKPVWPNVDILDEEDEKTVEWARKLVTQLDIAWQNLKQVTTSSDVFDDLQSSIANVKLPASSSPATRYYNFGIGSGVTYPALGFAVGDYLYFDVQTYHEMQLSTVLKNHIHFSLPNTTDIGDKFNFQLDVIAAGVNEAWAVPAGSPFSAEYTILANDEAYHRIHPLATIPAVNTTVSTIYQCRLERIAASADEYGSEVYIKFNDSHYKKDSVGSRQEYSK